MNPPVYGAPGPPSPPKKKSNGLATLFVIIGVGLVVLGIVGGFGAYLVLSSAKGRAMVGAMGEAVKISAKASKAPGTKELRALGCSEAMVMRVEDVEKLAGRFERGPTEEASFGETVVCVARPWGSAPSGERVAKTYVGAVGPRPKPFFVNVQQSGKVDSTELFDGSGVPMKGMVDGDDLSPYLPEGELDDLSPNLPEGEHDD